MIRAFLAGFALLVLTGMITAGCKTGKDNPFAEMRRDRPVPLRVDNNNFLDVSVFATSGGVRVRLGEVTGKDVGTFAIDPQRLSMAAGLQILVDPLGSGETFLSPVVFPTRSETVVLTVGAVLSQSYISLR